MASDADASIARIASTNHGVFTTQQARRVGMTDRMIAVRVCRGQWERLCRGVFRIGGAPETFDGACKAATLATTGASISGPAAAGLHGLTGFGPCPPEVTIGPGGNHRSALATVHERARFRRTKVRGIAVGSVDQTIVDLSGQVNLRRLARATDDALVQRRVHILQLEDRLVEESADGARGVRDLRWLVEARSDSAAIPESALEPHLHDILRTEGLPPFLLQPRLPWRSDGPGRVDALIPAWSLIVEADGRRWHARHEAFEVDRLRDAEALAAGYRTLRLTWAALTVERARSLALLRRIGTHVR